MSLTWYSLHCRWSCCLWINQRRWRHWKWYGTSFFNEHLNNAPSYLKKFRYIYFAWRWGTNEITQNKIVGGDWCVDNTHKMFTGNESLYRYSLSLEDKSEWVWWPSDFSWFMSTDYEWLIQNSLNTIMYVYFSCRWISGCHILFDWT